MGNGQDRTNFMAFYNMKHLTAKVLHTLRAYYLNYG